MIIPDSVVVGPKSFEVTMEQVTPAYEALFGYLVPAHQVRGTDFLGDWNEVPWVSGGPFLFERWIPGESLRLVRNSRYWEVDPDTGQALPFLDAVEFRFVPDEEAIDGFERRDLDLVFGLSGWRESEFTDPAMATTWSLGFEQVRFQFGVRRLDSNPGSLNEHLVYRQAIAHAIDRAALAEELGHGQVLDSYMASPALSTKPWSQYGYSPQRARGTTRHPNRRRAPSGPTAAHSATEP